MNTGFKKKKLLFLGFGSLCTYQYPALKAINQRIQVEGIFYQTRKDIMPQDLIKERECFLQICCFGTERIFRDIPKPLFRLLENIYIIFSGLLQIIRMDANHDIFVTGYLFFLLIPLMKFRFSRVVVWKFGIAEEFLLGNKAMDKIKFLFIKGIEKLFLPIADSFVVQSDGMARYVQKNFKAISKPIYKIPCCVDYTLFHFDDLGRKKIREKFGFNGCFVITHIGSGSAWRANDAIIEVFKTIKSKKENAVLLIISRDPIYKDLIGRNGIRHSMLISLSHHEVPYALWASDLALLLNIKGPITKVVAPIKYPEYLAAGLPIVIAGTTEEYIDIINQRYLGFVLDMTSCKWKGQLFEFLDYLEKNKKAIRKRATFIAKECLSWQSMQGVIDSAFKRDSLI